MTAQDTHAPLYSLHTVSRSYAKGGVTVDAVKSISIDVMDGEIVALQGPSGSGKSTLLQLLGALDTPTDGSITFDGLELARASDRELTELRLSGIGFVFQQFNLIPTLTAQENVAIAMVPTHARRQARNERARDLLQQVGLDHRRSHLPSRLSGGEQQRVAIARALANRPRVIIADEPTGNLDSGMAHDIMDLLLQLRLNAGLTVILATHDDEIAAVAERRVRLRDGCLAQ